MLNVGGNRLTGLPAGLFAGLTGAGGHSILQGNRLTGLPDETFAGLMLG